MAKRKTKTTEFPAASDEPTTVLQKKRCRRKYSLGDDYTQWKGRCDSLKSQAAFYASEATRCRNEHRKLYEAGAAGFCNARDDKAWEEANNLLSLAELKEDKRMNAWKVLPIERLDLPASLIALLKEHEFETIESVADWVNREHREPKKKLGTVAVEKIGDAINRLVAPYHKEITMPEIEKAKSVLAELSE